MEYLIKFNIISNPTRYKYLEAVTKQIIRVVSTFICTMIRKSNVTSCKFNIRLKLSLIRSYWYLFCLCVLKFSLFSLFYVFDAIIGINNHIPVT